MCNYAEPSQGQIPAGIRGCRFHSVEFPIQSLKMKYHCRLRKNGIADMFVLIKENSDVLHFLQVGEVLTMNYYCLDSAAPPESLETEIQFITKNDTGKFKGHYLIGLSILENKNPDMTATGREIHSLMR